jgi:hypothetical protein
MRDIRAVLQRIGPLKTSTEHLAAAGARLHGETVLLLDWRLAPRVRGLTRGSLRARPDWGLGRRRWQLLPPVQGARPAVIRCCGPVGGRELVRLEEDS